MKFHITRTIDVRYCVSFTNVRGELLEVIEYHPETAMNKMWDIYYGEIMEVIKNEDSKSRKERQKEVQRSTQDESRRSILHTYTKSSIEREREIAEIIEFEEEFQEGQAIFLTWVKKHDTMGHCALWVMNASLDDLENARRHFDEEAEYHFASEILFCDKDLINRLPYKAITLAGRNYIEEKAREYRNNKMC